MSADFTVSASPLEGWESKPKHLGYDLLKMHQECKHPTQWLVMKNTLMLQPPGVSSKGASPESKVDHLEPHFSEGPE